MSPDFISLLSAAIPSLVSGIGLYLVSQNMRSHQDKLEKREEDYVKSEKHILDTLIATAEGTEAIAKAIQRVPDFKCNGDMKAAIEKVEKVLDDHKDFLREKAAEAMDE